MISAQIVLFLVVLPLKITSCTTPQRVSNHDHYPSVKSFRQLSLEKRGLSDEWIIQTNSRAVSAECPCVEPQWCNPISSSVSPIRESGEVFGFATDSTGEFYNWTHISTVAWSSSDELMCRAHQHGARVILAAPSFDLKQLIHNITYVTEWVNSTLNMVKARHHDGIVFDYEGALPPHSSEGKAYATLVRATRDAFHQNKPPFQVTTCVPWSPDGIDGRFYPYLEFAKASDLLYVMDYDTRSQVKEGPCIAGPNAPIMEMVWGIHQYENLGIDSKKLVLGVPWYGYRYPCLNGTRPDQRSCPIQHVPFHGVNCSDAAGSEIKYSKILQTYSLMTEEEIAITGGGMRRDETANAVFFNHIATNTVNKYGVYQYWFDDARSLRDKYALAKLLKLGGVGPYTFDYLDTNAFPVESKAMWSSFDAFKLKQSNDLSHIIAKSVLRKYV